MIKRIFLISVITLYTINFNISTIFANFVSNDISAFKYFENDLPEIEADSAILMDIDTGTILYSKNEHMHEYPASITKILTTLIALEYNKPEDIITFSEDAVFGIDRSSSNLAIDVGEQLNMTDALYCIMLMSANEVSAGVAEHISGSVEKFAEIMNKRAKEIGAIDSNFKNPHGLHDSEHYTSAYDMAMIAREAYRNPEFRKIISTNTYQIPPTNIQPEIRYLANQHYMFKNTKYHYNGCTGGKTGFTDEAQSTLVTFAERDGLKLVSVVLKEIGNTKYVDTKKLLDYGFDNFKTESIDIEYPKSLPVYDSNQNQIGDVNIYSENDRFKIVVPKSVEIQNFKQNIDLPEKLIAPVNADIVVGTASFDYEDTQIFNTDLKTSHNFEVVSASKILDEKTEPNSNSYLEKSIIILATTTILTVILILFWLLHRRISKPRGLNFRKRF